MVNIWDKIKSQALRIFSGCLHSTPYSILLFETSDLPLNTEVHRINSIVWKEIMKTWNILSSTSQILEYSTYAHFLEASVFLTFINNVHQRLRFPNYDINYIDSNVCRGNSTNSHMLKDITHNNYAGYITLYAYGSVNNGKTGVGIYSLTLQSHESVWICSTELKVKQII